MIFFIRSLGNLSIVPGDCPTPPVMNKEERVDARNL